MNSFLLDDSFRSFLTKKIALRKRRTFDGIYWHNERLHNDINE